MDANEPEETGVKRIPGMLKRFFKRCLVDYPGVVTGTFVVLPVAIWLLSRRYHWPLGKLVGLPDKLESASVVAVYLGLAAVAAISAGFSGVVIVFGLTPQSELFQRFRLEAGSRMVANWMSIIGTAFLAAGLSIGAALAETLSHRSLGAVLFAIGCLLFAHSAGRATWILFLLLTLVKNEDEAQVRAALGKLNDD